MTAQNIKEELVKDMENLRKKESKRNPGNKKSLSSNKNHMEGYSSRLEKVEDRISELEDKTEIKENTEKIKQLKSCERNMQEFNDSIKRPNLRIIGIEEGEEGQVKGICNTINKIITENFPNLKEVLLI
jgi:TolA-binding protein